MNIKQIQKDTPIKGVFFFDTMIWINIISPSFDKDNRFIKYISFFDKVYKDKYAKIAVSSLIISEIINLYLRKIALPLYAKSLKTDVHKIDYKKQFRISDHYKKHYALVCDEINARLESVVFTDDLLQEYDIIEASTYPKLDFNDFNYYKICKKKGYTLVTDDSDFYVNDISILTLNTDLYKRQFETSKN